MRKFAKKPQILKLKCEVANLIFKKCDKIKYFRHRLGCYWNGDFKFEDKVIYIYWQNYVQGRLGVNYVSIRKEDYSAISKKELVRIKNTLINKK